ncbi:MAG: preprotein translocase subunit SecG [Bacteroidaceae bacterium]|nr:preprotein translocase subunit SecG [Bacteroidaceae bacterium]
MYTLFIVLFVVVAIAMIFIVLIQESKGGGLASSFSASNQIMGVRKTTDIIEKLTWGFAVAMVVLSIACAFVAPRVTAASSVVENAATEQAPLGAKSLPGFDASQAPAADQKAAPAKEAAPAAAEAPAETPAAE